MNEAQLRLVRVRLRRRRRTSAAGVLLLALLLIALILRTHPGLSPAPRALASKTTYPFSAKDYPWPHAAPAYEPLISRCPVPDGYTRATVALRSWGEWLRYLPLLPAGSPVRTCEGLPVRLAGSPSLGAVIDLDVRRHQEGADVIFRLRAEFLRWAGREAEISFPADRLQLSWPEWKRGVRPRLVGRHLELARTAAPDGSRASFDKYLAAVFAWAGTPSLAKTGRPKSYAQLRPGDFLVRPGSPGHAVLIADVMRDARGRTWVLMLQGYTPPQSAHVLSPDGRQAWVPVAPHAPPKVPGWGAFTWSDLREFR